MNKKTVILLSTTMMSIATAACAFCMAQTANAADTYVDFGTSTAKVTTPPPQLKIALLKKPILLRQMA
ncbi:hypothetical protein [Gardnerella vaginalis]|uniref:hypothetical protein n=1 Tax=Gardnerella vaginalis TaxID=2702 RepID=UPI0005B56607|nr:hypothetical protein [Gardnerella vaginalis]BAQ33104.1 hypothetical protein GAVG_0452 [Gardnerella vaginalis ATCC 14018 = JCM 11026]